MVGQLHRPGQYRKLLICVKIATLIYHYIHFAAMLLNRSLLLRHLEKNPVERMYSPLQHDSC